MATPATFLSDARMLHRESKKSDSSYWTDQSESAMVATAHYRATLAGAEILRAGGNAIDAAVACSLALGVCEPAESGLGGMAMMLVHSASENRTFLIDGACRAPRRASPEAIAQAASRYRGHGVVAVPSCPAVLDHALSRYGTMSADEVARPAIAIAEDGFLVSSYQNRVIRDYRARLSKGNAGTLYLDSASSPLRVGFRLQNPALARTLRRIAEYGFQDFYRGGIAREIAGDMEAHGGFIRREDLENFPDPEENEPVTGEIGGWEVRTAGPPAGGLSLLQMLSLYNKIEPGNRVLDNAEAFVLLARVIRQARKDRKRFRKKIPMRADGKPMSFLEEGYAEDTLETLRNPGEDPGGNTTHLSVMDATGNVVSLTQSIDRLFGAKVLHPELGFLYNSYLKAFKIQSKTHPHYLRPGAMARSNAAPTILFDNHRPFAALGSTGSERIASSLLQVIVRLRHQSGFESIHAPRLHCTPERDVLLEIERFPAFVPEALVSRGFRLWPLESYSHMMGGVQMVQKESGRYLGTSEPRRDSAAAGPERAEPSRPAR